MFRIGKLLLPNLELLLSLFSHLYDLLSDFSIALFQLQYFVLQLFILIAHMLNLLRLELLARTLFLGLGNLQLLNLQDKFVLLLFEAVNFLDKRDVFLHYFVVLLCVELRVLLKSYGNVLQISFQVLALARVFLVQVTFGSGGSRSGNVGLGHVLLVQTHNSLLQFLVVADLAQHFVNVILKLSFICLLSHYPLSKMFTFYC